MRIRVKFRRHGCLCRQSSSDGVEEFPNKSVGSFVGELDHRNVSLAQFGDSFPVNPTTRTTVNRGSTKNALLQQGTQPFARELRS
jgi:hypothetical protein